MTRVGPPVIHHFDGCTAITYVEVNLFYYHGIRTLVLAFLGHNVSLHIKSLAPAQHVSSRDAARSFD